jgi:hypothetical protein
MRDLQGSSRELAMMEIITVGDGDVVFDATDVVDDLQELDDLDPIEVLDLVIALAACDQDLQVARSDHGYDDEDPYWETGEGD